MANDGEFQEQLRQLGKQIAEFDQLPDGPVKTAGREVIQLLMNLHGAGLDRMMEIVFDSGSMAPGIIDKLGQDSVVGSLLLLYSLHPEDLHTRVLKAVERLRTRLRKLSYGVELAALHEGAVQIRLTSLGHSCGSSGIDLRSIVEDGIYEFAPEVTTIEILGLEAPAGFVTLESLVGQRFAVVEDRSPEREGAD